MRRAYPEKIISNGWPESTPLEKYVVEPLILDASGNVLSGPTLEGKGDVFTFAERRHDLECLLKPLPVKVIRLLATHRKVKFGNDYSITRPRKDDLLTFGRSTNRKLCIYGLGYLLGRPPTDLQADTDAFVADFLKFTDIRPMVGGVAKKLLWDFISDNDRVRVRGIPWNVAKLFNEHGRGGNMDTAVIGTTPDTVKVDQRMSYLSVMSQMTSPTENLLTGRVWVKDFKYNPDDSYGIYNIDVWVSEELPDSPLGEEKEGTFITVVGNVTGTTVLKPTMDILKHLESLGMAKVSRINWAWRLCGRPAGHPYKRLYDVMCYIKETAGVSTHFWKLVAASIWGLTLHKFIDYDGGKPTLMGNFWFNPVIGYTVTDRMRAINFGMKLAASGKMSSEVVDALTGPVGDWYDEGVVKVKGPSDYTHISPIYHLAPGDDRLNLLERIKLSKAHTLKVPVKSRYGLEALWELSTSKAIKEALGTEREAEFRISINGSKRKFSKEIRKLRMCDLLECNFRGTPYRHDELEAVDVSRMDWNAALFELTGDEAWLPF